MTSSTRSPLARLFTFLLGEQAPAAPPAPDPQGAGDVRQQLEANLQKLQAEVERLRAKASGSSDGAQESPQSQAYREQRVAWRAAREGARTRLEEDILKLHQTLQTHIDKPRLERLHRIMVAHHPAPSGPAGDLDRQIERHVLHFLHLQCGEQAWERLLRLMQPAGLAWPISDESLFGKEPEEKAAVLAQQVLQDRAAFLGQPALRAAELLLGEVEVWSFAYPEEGSWLWQKMALLAVGSALRAQLFLAALELWMWRPPELDQELQALLRPYLEQTQVLLKLGVASATETAILTDQVTSACRELIPLRIWDFVRDRMRWEAGSSDTPVVETLAEGLSDVDPVCGMALSADHVAARLTYQGQAYFFCQPACLARFEADPTHYLGKVEARSQAGLEAAPPERVGDPEKA